MSKKIIILFSFLLVFSLLNGQIKGQEFSLGDLTAQTLSSTNVSTLPNSPFYFLKELNRNIQRLFIFDNVKKIDFELKVLDEKLLETKKLVENNPNQVEALKKALENYKKQYELLVKRLEQIKDKTNNENLDKVIENILNRGIKHQIVIEELISKMEEKTKNELKNNIEELENQSEKIITETPLKVNFQDRLPEVLNKVVENQLQEQNNNPALGIKLYTLVNDLQEQIQINKPAIGKKIEDLKVNIVNNAVLPNIVEQGENESEVEKDKAVQNSILKVLESIPVAKRLMVLEQVKEIIKNRNQVNEKASRPLLDKEQATTPNLKEKVALDRDYLLNKVDELQKRVLDLERERSELIKTFQKQQPALDREQTRQTETNQVQNRALDLEKNKSIETFQKQQPALDREQTRQTETNQVQNRALDLEKNKSIETFQKQQPALDREQTRQTETNQVQNRALDLERESDIKYIMVTQPSNLSDQNYKPGTRMKVQWRSLNVKRVKVYLCDTKTNWCNLFGGIPNEGILNTNSFEVYLDPNHPYFPLESGRIKVEDASNPNIYGFSGYFSVGENDVKGPKTLSLVFPNTEQNLVAGSYLDLRWNSQNIQKVKIYLCEVNLNASLTDRERCKLVVPESGVVNNNFYRLYLDPNHPYIPLNLGLVKIVDFDNESIFVKTPYIKVKGLNEIEVKEERMTTTLPNVNIPTFEKRPEFLNQ